MFQKRHCRGYIPDVRTRDTVSLLKMIAPKSVVRIHPDSERAFAERRAPRTSDTMPVPAPAHSLFQQRGKARRRLT